VTILCAGTEGFFTLEDMLAAGAIADAMNVPDAGMDDLTHAAIGLFRQHAGDLAGALKDCKHAKVLRDLGYGGDIEYCMKKDRLDVTAVYQNGKITRQA
jgi:2-phosphosulfolactate phosphatase